MRKPALPVMLSGHSPERLACGTDWPFPRAALSVVVMLSVSNHLLPPQTSAAAGDSSLRSA